MTKRNFQSMLQENVSKVRPNTVSTGGGNVWRMVHTPAKQHKKINDKNPAGNAYKLLKSRKY